MDPIAQEHLLTAADTDLFVRCPSEPATQERPSSVHPHRTSIPPIPVIASCLAPWLRARRRNRQWHYAAAAVSWALGCEGPADVLGGAPAAENPMGSPPPIQDPSTFQPEPSLDPQSLGLPVATDGTLVLAAAGDVELRYDPKQVATPLKAQLTCLSWLTQCSDASGGNLDGCVGAAPRCQTERPWDEAIQCCPNSCIERYESLRNSGTDSLDALESSLGGVATCVPGYQSWMDGAMP